MFSITKTFNHPAAICVFLLLSAAPSLAQDAFVAQVGDANRGANLDLTGQSSSVIAQIGNRNTSVQMTLGGRDNQLASVQVGQSNQNLSMTQGRKNITGTFQSGRNHVAQAIVLGNFNRVATLQFGFANASRVQVDGNHTETYVTQNGAGLNSNVALIDGMTARSAAADPLAVRVNQSMGQDPVNVRIMRDAAGTLMIQPGTATTVLRLSG
ncbi:hypothetical protein SAMN05428995_10478 [Loktanella sp. DSM 29012]|uniref:Curlin associated repeat-containing protein n=1 Tax=Loktanella gaetbuli TaxID=2881335 RepID=A0ABS8BY20_9RHOB|nr:MULTISPECIES: hypothetical protein [Loktanella]MCB5200474.1 hypothetical protein [Loktanella gaetbuli]SEQ37747.1 hypothetical protein SAMN05428995_10478 [Loktanella sp. DSM 29012]